MISFLTITISAFIVFICSYLLVALIGSWAQHRRILDIPNERSSHDIPVPKGGGISIVILVILTLWVFYLIDSVLYPLHVTVVFTVGSILIAVISLLDDLHSLRNSIRFCMHSLAAVIIIWGIGYVSVLWLPIFERINLGFLGIILTFLYVTGLTNAYNFMDGIDGIAAIQAIVAGIGWAFIGYMYSDPMIMLPGVLIASASAGFLIHNWHPAKIFLGDVGSAFLGFSFAYLTIVAVQKDPVFLVIGVLFVWPFIFDTVYTLFRRLSRGENIFEAHRSHLYQRLVIQGWSHRSVTLLYGLLASLALLPAVLLSLDYTYWYIVGVFITVLSFLLLIFITVRNEKNIVIHKASQLNKT
jgi:UDP-N-acetylmuramyl pentapeptide phosphotransferase/UDP-N-acetylglucosamine-1-phosphate transferase